jgi:uncharacterized protein YbjT (DUF2867 family)
MTNGSEKPAKTAYTATVADGAPSVPGRSGTPTDGHDRSDRAAVAAVTLQAALVTLVWPGGAHDQAHSGHERRPTVKIAVAGGTGLVGRHTVEAVRRVGHHPVVLARSVGVDLTTAAGLAAALDGVDAVIDATNTPSVDTNQVRAFFATATTHLLAAELDAGIRHHVVLSIVGLDRLPDEGHYAGKRAQERLALSGPVPASVVRATQFFDFAAQMVSWTRRGESAALPPLLLQPVAVTDVAKVLVEVALGEPVNGIGELAGPQTQDLVDMARRTLVARGDSLRLVPTWRGRYGVALAGEVLLPGPDARIASTTFDDWLTTQTPTGS